MFRALRPLVLIVKAYLKVSNLNDVASGGLVSASAALLFANPAHVCIRPMDQLSIQCCITRYAGLVMQLHKTCVHVKPAQSSL